MQNTIQFKPQFLHFRKTTVSLNPFLESTVSLHSFDCSSKSPLFTTSPSLSRQTQIRKSIVCARKSKRRYGSERPTKVVLQLISLLASNLKILPQPLDLFVQTLFVENEEGLGFLNGFNGGTFNPWKRPTKRRRNEKKILGFLLILGSCILCLIFVKELRADLLFGILGFIFFASALIKEWRRVLKHWILGFCCVGILVGLGFRGNQGMKWIKEIRVPSSILEIVRGGKRRGRWAF